MTREKAVNAARILEKIQDFEAFMDIVLETMDEYEINPTTRENLKTVLNAEMNQLNKVLEEL